MKNIIIVAPHPDDETLGCGGTLLKHKNRGDKIHWLIITGMTEDTGFDAERVRERNRDIKKVSKMYDFDTVTTLNLPTTKLDTLPIQSLIEMIGKVIRDIKPEVLYVPFSADIHTDHQIVFQAIAACCKWFRFESINRVLAYETLSETDFIINPASKSFAPNVYVDISEFLNKKLEIMRIYQSESGTFPFPRSGKAIKALSEIRGAAAGCISAEAFMLLKEIV